MWAQEWRTPNGHRRETARPGRGPRSHGGDSRSAGHAPAGPGINWSPAVAPEALKPLIDTAADQAGVDRDLLDALVASESAYDPQARSRAGALGLTQLMPDTARALGITNPLDPAQNLNGGARYLSDMLNRFGGDLQLALAAYNAGPGAVDRFGGVPPYPETRAYIAKVLELYEQRRARG
jgi:soluble lytic murein transglycosylase-like protein